MPRLSPWLLSLVVTIGCSQASLKSSPPSTGDDSGSELGEDDGGEGADAGKDGVAPRGTSNLRVVAANISSGPDLNYQSGEGIRLLQGLKPDVALLQELKYGAGTGTGTDADVRTFVTTTFGAEYNYFRESGDGIDIPNGVVSRYPITASGRWVDPKATNRGFVYAKIAVPGAHPLWAVSVHLLTSNANARNDEAASLTSQLKAEIADGDYVVIGGDFNTDNRTEPCLTTFAELVDASGKAPADQQGNSFTNGPRTRPYDWLIGDAKLVAQQVPTVLGANQFPAGLIFDSRVYAPLSDVSPVQETDSAANNMQHMPVVKDFHLP